MNWISRNFLVWTAILLGALVAIMALSSPSFRQGADAVYQSF